MLELIDLSIKIHDKYILKNSNLQLQRPGVYIITGPNGVGKSSLIKAIIGNKEVLIDSGDILFKNKSLTNLAVDEIANTGILSTFQEPVSLPGVKFINFIKILIENKAKLSDKIIPTSKEILELTKSKIKELKLSEDFYLQEVNHNISGGQKKQMELLQVAILDPEVIIFDEIEAGMDINKLEILTNFILSHRNSKIFLIVSHNQKFIEAIKPDEIYTMQDTKLVKVYI